MTTTTRSLPVQLAELIESAQHTAEGQALKDLRAAYTLALQLGEELALERVTVDRSRAAIGGEKHRADIYRGRVLELQGQADQAQAVRDAAANRIADLADERDALKRQLAASQEALEDVTRQLSQARMSRDALAARVENAQAALSGR
jgi:chromosome segregation ATPase